MRIWGGYVEIGQLVFIGGGRPDTPRTDHFRPLFAWKKNVPTLHSTGLEKAQRRSKNKSLFCPSNAFYRFSFTRSAVREFHFEVTDTATMVSQYREREKNTHFFYAAKITVSWAPEIFPSPRPIWTFTAKKGVCQSPDFRAKCDAGINL